MGLASFISGLFQLGNTVEQVAGTFRPNAEQSAIRAQEITTNAQTQYSKEFIRQSTRTWLDVFTDSFNRLVRPTIAFSIFMILPATVIWPEKLATVFQSWALLPQEYWVVLGVVLAFYFGGRMQLKGHEFKQSLAAAAVQASAYNKTAESVAIEEDGNAALDDWKRENG